MDELWLAGRVHEAKLAIASHFRDIKPSHGLNRKPLVDKLRGQGHALQDIQDAIGELLSDGKLQTYEEWKESFSASLPDPHELKEGGVFMTPDQLKQVWGKLRLENDGLVPGKGLFCGEAAVANNQKTPEIPAKYREGGKADGEPLTVKYVSKCEKYDLPGSLLSKKRQSLQRMKHGREYVYLFKDIASLGAARNIAKNDGH